MHYCDRWAIKYVTVVHSFIILKIVIPLRLQYFELCDVLQFVTGRLASLFSGTLY